MADVQSYYAYDPKIGVAGAYAGIMGVSLVIHIWQNFHYRFWRVMFFMVWGVLVYTAGWTMRAISGNNVGNQNLYISQYVLIIAAPPIFAAAEYNVLGRLLQYVPMHSPLNPRRIMYFFIYLGALVESLTAAGGARMATAGEDNDRLKSGATIVAAASIMQIFVELFFIFMVAKTHRRVIRSKQLTSDLRIICITLYGTATLVLARSIYRTVEKFSIMNAIGSERCEGTCATVLRHEWYFFVFEGAPMILYSLWLNLFHPGRYLPKDHTIYLGYDKVEREAVGWADKRPRWQTFVDPFDWIGMVNKQNNHEAFWETPDKYPAVEKTGKANRRRRVQAQKVESQTSTAGVMA